MDRALVEKMSNAFGPSGFEDEAAAVICEKLDSMKVKYQKDVMGNIIVKLDSKSGNPTLLLDAHMDEVGLMVQHIDPKGFLKVVTLGGIVPNTLVSKVVKVKASKGKFVYGVTATIPPHINKNPDAKIDVEDLWLDIGAKSDSEVKKLGIRVGTPAVVDCEFKELSKSRIMGKALDDRIGCCMLLELLKEYKSKKWSPKGVNFCFSFSVQEEVGLRGVGAVVTEIEPDAFIAVEGTICADIPGVPEQKKITQLDKGPAVTAMDRSVITPAKVIEYIINQGETAKIPFQVKTPAFGGTNSGAVHKMNKGIVCMGMATPCRYIHTQASVLSTSDYDNGIKLLKKLAGNVKKCLD